MKHGWEIKWKPHQPECRVVIPEKGYVDLRTRKYIPIVNEAVVLHISSANASAAIGEPATLGQSHSQESTSQCTTETGAPQSHDDEVLLFVHCLPDSTANEQSIPTGGGIICLQPSKRLLYNLIRTQVIHVKKPGGVHPGTKCMSVPLHNLRMK